MNFTHYDMGQLSSGQVVEVALSGSAANVRLMDSSNFSSFKAGRRHRYIGGLVKQSPYRMQVPNSGRWHVTVDMIGLRGTVRSTARVLAGALPTARSLSLASVPSLVQGEGPPGFDFVAREHDVFISHAFEDKDAVVRPLAAALVAEGLNVWYDEFELRIGDSLRRKIDQGLANSRVGLVVLSHAFIAKGWTNYELDGIVTRSVSGEQVLLPIWHNISKQEVVAYSPSLADKVARSTATHTVEEIAKEISELIESRR
ncbi:DUF1883 domain-containing protein [Luteimonas salinilitoris]|uniref:DUF1883 domain-containing protein n=1 Tax=Luteimonas salinilitoris TaxID=3237697 RepID=A0ABV4HV78_9GAMM